MTARVFYVIVLVMRRIRFINHYGLLVLIFAFVIRLIVGLSVSFDFESTSQWFAAKNIAHGLSYSFDPHHPTALRTPGYSFLLAFFIKLFGENTLPIIIFLALVGAINAAVCALLTRNIFSEKTGFLAGILYALIPYLALQECTTQVGLVAAGLLSGTYFLFKARTERKVTFTLISALFFLCAYLTRPTVGLLPIFIGATLLVESARKKTAWYALSAALFFSVFLLGLLPWAIRNNRTLGQFHIAQTNFWYNVYAANHPRAFQIYPYAALDNLGPLFMQNQLPPEGNEVVIEEWYRRKAIDEIKQAPLGLFLKRNMQKLFYLWHIRLVPFAERIGNDPDTGRSLDQPRPLAKNLAYSIPYTLLIIFTLIGCWQERKRKGLLFFFAGFLCFFSLPHMITISYSKYTLAVYFVLIIFAARAIASFAERKPRDN